MKLIAGIIHGGRERRGSTPRLLRRWLLLALGMASLGLTPGAWAGATPILVERYLPVPIQGFASCWEFFSRTNDGNKPEVVETNELNENTYATPAFVDGQIFLRGRRYLYCLEDDDETASARR